MILSPNFPTIEELSKMPLEKLRMIDIKSVDEEKLVQKEVDLRLVTMPLENPIKPSELKVPDIKTKEEEEHWQKKIDERNAEIKKNILPKSKEPETQKPETQKVICETCKKEFKNDFALRMHKGRFHKEKVKK